MADDGHTHIHLHNCACTQTPTLIGSGYIHAHVYNYNTRRKDTNTHTAKHDHQCRSSCQSSIPVPELVMVCFSILLLLVSNYYPVLPPSTLIQTIEIQPVAELSPSCCGPVEKEPLHQFQVLCVPSFPKGTRGCLQMSRVRFLFEKIENDLW